MDLTVSARGLVVLHCDGGRRQVTRHAHYATLSVAIAVERAG